MYIRNHIYCERTICLVKWKTNTECTDIFVQVPILCTDYINDYSFLFIYFTQQLLVLTSWVSGVCEFVCNVYHANLSVSEMSHFILAWGWGGHSHSQMYGSFQMLEHLYFIKWRPNCIFKTEHSKKLNYLSLYISISLFITYFKS